MDLKDGVPCEHPGCANHVTHPCEGCGRIGASSKLTAVRIAELEAEIVERRKDYSACIRDQDARIAELEAQLAFANATVSALRGQLESTTAERDAAQERERVLIEDLRYALEIVIAYAPNTTDPAWAEDILNKLPAPPEEATNADA